MNWSDAFLPYGKGRITEPGGLKDAALGSRLATYKRQVAKRYRVIDVDEGIEKQLPKGPLFISTKLDGELWFLVKREGEVALCAYNGRVLTGVPVTEEGARKLEKVESIVVAGELLAALPGTEGRPRCFHVSRTLADPTLAEHLTFHPFDLVEDGGKEVADRAYGERLKRINELFGQAGKISIVATQEGDAAAAAGCYREWVATQKFEGIVVRSEQGLTFKIKPTFTIDALVLAYGERVVNGVNQLRELELALRRDDGSFQIIGSCGGGFSEDDRTAWREKLAKLEVPSAFRMANREGTLCHFVEPRIVVEIRCNDLVDSDGNDCAIARMALSYKEGEGYSAIGPMPIVSLVSPRFLRERTDKTTDVGSIGLEQVFSRLPFDSRFNAPVAATRSEPTVVERKAWVKGETMVRKYVAVATNRPFDRNYPPFVVHFTDYSAARKTDALKVAIRVASTKESLDKHIAAWVEENVKKGWLEYGAPAPAAPAKAVAPKKKAKVSTEAPAEGAAEAPAAPAPSPDGAAAAPAAEAAAAPTKPKRTRAKKAETEPT